MVTLKWKHIQCQWADTVLVIGNQGFWCLVDVGSSLKWTKMSLTHFGQMPTDLKRLVPEGGIIS